jgi:hypothetical protein
VQHDTLNQVGMGSMAGAMIPLLTADRVLVQGNAKVHLPSWLVQPSKMGLKEARS